MQVSRVGCFPEMVEAGVNVALGVVLHKFADGVTLVTLLLHAGRKPREAILYSLALAAATPAGALISSFAISGLPPGDYQVAPADASGEPDAPLADGTHQLEARIAVSRARTCWRQRNR